jgi:hypothetical protein
MIDDASEYFRDISSVLQGKKLKGIEISENFKRLRVILEDDTKLEVESTEELTVFRLNKENEVVNKGALDFFNKIGASWEW